MHLSRFLLPGVAAALLGLAACDVIAPVEPVPRPPERPAKLPAPVEPARPEQTAESRQLEQYYRSVQDSLVAQGLLRTDGGGPDTPFTERQLVENFVRIALFEEYATEGGRIVARQTESRLHRWETPIEMQVEFGDTVPRDKRVRDRNAISAYADRLSRVTSLPIRQVPSGGNFNVFVVNEPERRALGPRLRKLIPGMSEAAIETVVDLPRTSYCLVFALDPDDSGAYTRAVAIIRGEHPDLLRLSCIHEELAQGLGLSNDSPAARPSVFNDDEEFGLLTTHDEYLLRILYDDRLEPGMDAKTARLRAAEVAAELLPES
ncbi:DUF2927 domain-containing protein [Tranquillimonas alkanivorans]|uniref:DUF2927 domain-containing protein n=1 Tax=Tranquillimonas alkanivorans TaxID=441119 RepID=A0A1I5NDF1_9RHOB|nr:DUF2927 domain-containing protein [Tranquillimonas alkanivorans]SFP19865.1 Protein of unknown function [Tranquillimonas alkanivorans]